VRRSLNNITIVAYVPTFMWLVVYSERFFIFSFEKYADGWNVHSDLFSAWYVVLMNGFQLAEPQNELLSKKYIKRLLIFAHLPPLPFNLQIFLV
jgi:hypothetical protein